MNEHVLLLHGLWMRGFTLVPLQRRLRAAGYTVHIGDYASVWRSGDDSVNRLLARVRRLRAPKLHLVGHSLGGLIALKMLEQAPDLCDGTVVCLGSPLRGSVAARGLAGWPFGAAVLGRNGALLHRGFQAWHGEQPLGVVAGRWPVGIGTVFGALGGPHDGTVSVAETRLPGLTDHCTVASTHTGLVFSRAVATQVVSFLRHARFNAVG